MNLLFVCTHNACRSVLAEVITRRLAGDRIRVASAGSEPSGRIHPLTVEYLRSTGHSTAGLRSKSFEAVADILGNRIEALLNQPFESMGKAELSDLLTSLGNS